MTDEYKEKLQKRMGLAFSDGVRINEEFEASTELHYLLISSRKKCKAILRKEHWEDGDLIDAFINLHIVLEVGLNTLYRYIALSSTGKGLSKVEVMRNVDGISFLDKTILFIYSSNFHLGNQDQRTKSYHTIIKKLKNFNNMRNFLLHGHAIAAHTTAYSEQIEQTDLMGKLTKEMLIGQVQDFLFIMEGITVFLDKLDIDQNFNFMKDQYKLICLDTEFIPMKFKVSESSK